MGGADLGAALTTNKELGANLAVGSDSDVDLEFDEQPNMDLVPELDLELDEEPDVDLDASVVDIEWSSVT